MFKLNELKSFAREAKALLARENDLAAFEVYCSSDEQTVARLNYTSEIPSRGVEELKSLSADGFALRIVMRNDPHRSCIASEVGDLGARGVSYSLCRAR